MTSRLYNNRYQVIQELDATPFTRIFKARVVENPSDLETKGHQEHKGTEESKASDIHDTDTLVALKKLKNTKGFEEISLDTLKEAKILKEINDHPNIIKLLDSFVDKPEAKYKKESTFLVMEFMKLDLHTLIHVDNYKFTEADIKSIIQQVLLGLAHLHKHSILHRDIKPSNILLGQDGTAKISDFGSARLGHLDEANMTPRVTTRYYRAPEILFGAKSYTSTVDSWAVGCTMAEMIIGKHVFPGHSEIDELDKIFSIQGTPNEETWPGVTQLPNYIEFEPINKVPFEKIFQNLSSEAVDLLQKLLALNPNQRITAQEALSHPFFASGVSPQESIYQEYVKTYVPKKKQTNYDEDF